VETVALDQRSISTSHPGQFPFRASVLSLLSPRAVGSREVPIAGQLVVQMSVVFLAYFIAGKLGQATTNIRSSNLGPVWPAYGIAVAAFLAYGYRVWPGIAASAFLVAFSSAVPPLAAAGQAVGATGAALTATLLLRRIDHFDPSLSRLRDALGLVVVGAFGSALISAMCL
jgi:integral membrane sensor domain MASE1